MGAMTEAERRELAPMNCAGWPIGQWRQTMPDNRETNEMIERVAKAIYDAHVSLQPRPEDWDRWGELIAAGHQGANRVYDTRALARAAIEAMREPSRDRPICDYPLCRERAAGQPLTCNCRAPNPFDAALGIVR
jgi:hypothetical protein